MSMSKALTFEELVPSALKGRFAGIRRPYSPEDVARLRGSFPISYTLAERGANKLWRLLHERPYVHALGAVTGNQAMQMVRGGLEAIYLSGWQVAADANVAGAMYPDQSLYPANSGPELARKINRTFKRADEIEHAEGSVSRDWFAPIVADAEAGFGGPLNAFEIMKAYIEAGAAGVHFEDQLASDKKCGHLGGKVLIPTSQHERSLAAARLAADTMGVPTIIVARTDAESVRLTMWTSATGRARRPKPSQGGNRVPGRQATHCRPSNETPPFEQNVIDRRLVLIGNVGDGCRQREHEVIIGNGKEFGFAFGWPPRPDTSGNGG